MQKISRSTKAETSRMQETGTSKQQQYNDMMWLKEAELESIIASEPSRADDARYILGRLLIEGTFPETVPRNEQKGVNWLKTAAKNGHMDALEHKTYWAIRFDKQPNLKRIQEALTQIADTGKSSRACNTLAEFAHAQSKGGTDVAKTKEAAKYYQTSAEMGCLIGKHWSGVFAQEGSGVTKNVDKAIQLLTEASKAGNGQSSYQLFIIYSKVEGKKDVVQAYKCLNRAVTRGVTYFDELNAYFKDNYDVLAPYFLETKKPAGGLTVANQEEILNLHNAFVNEIQQGFMAALAKDRMYKRPCGSVTDQQIWLVGVLVKYFVNTVLRFNHRDFMHAIR